MSQLTEYQKQSLHKLGEGIQLGKWSNEALVELIKLAGDYLNLMPVTNYALKNNLSYPGARKNTTTRQNVEIFNTKYIIDNE